jgi:hypothetical protein
MDNTTKTSKQLIKFILDKYENLSLFDMQKILEQNFIKSEYVNMGFYVLKCFNNIYITSIKNVDIDENTLISGNYAIGDL